MYRLHMLKTPVEKERDFSISIHEFRPWGSCLCQQGCEVSSGTAESSQHSSSKSCKSRCRTRAAPEHDLAATEVIAITPKAGRCQDKVMFCSIFTR